MNSADADTSVPSSEPAFSWARRRLRSGMCHSQLSIASMLVMTRILKCSVACNTLFLVRRIHGHESLRLAKASKPGVFSSVIVSRRSRKTHAKEEESRPPCRSNSDFTYVDREGADKSALFENFV